MLALTVSALAPLCHLRHGPRPESPAVIELVRAGLAMATVERMVAGGKSIRGRAGAHHRGGAAGARRNGWLTLTSASTPGATHA